MWKYDYTDELYHYGIQGMKWGVRRYQNYNGSYTQAGLKRYNKAMSTYEQRKADYKASKQQGVRGDSLRYKKAKVKEAKRDVKKHYEHLAQDKKADKGKIRYASGQRITYNNTISNTLAKIGSLSLAAAAYNSQTNALGNESVTNVLAGIGALSVSASIAQRAIDYPRNNELRAYYSHTSNY